MGETTDDMRTIARTQALEELREHFAVIVPETVRWGDMDAYQHVNNTVYFRYFETARIDYFARSGLVESGLPSGVGPILAETSCRFRAPVSFPDSLHVGARVVRVATDRLWMQYALFSEALERVAATGTGLVVTVDYDTGEKAPLPDTWLAAVRATEGEHPVEGL